VETGNVSKLPLGRVFRGSWRQLIAGTFIMLATYTLFYLMTTFTLTYGTTASSARAAAAAAKAAGKPFDAAAFVPGLGYPRENFLLMLIVGVAFFGVFTLVSGPVAERVGRRRMLLGVTAGIFVFGLLFVPLFASGFVGVQGLLILGFILMGLTFGPMGAVLPELFPANVRYTGSAISYNVSSILGAAVAPFIAVALWGAAHGSTWLVGVYLSAMALITLVALFVSRDTGEVDYSTNLS
jgi:MFS family permease